MASTNDKDDIVQQNFAQLSAGQQKEALEGAFKQVKDCHPATIPIYRYICQKFDEGCDDLSIPAMLVPAMLDMGFDGPYGPDNFKRKYLQKFGEEGRDWCMVTKTQFFKNSMSSKTDDIENCISSDSGDVEYKVPGWPSKSFIISKRAGNKASWPFVTPRFARMLLKKPRKQISHNLNDFYDRVHDFTRSLKQAIDRKEVALVNINTELQKLEPAFQRATKRLKGMDHTKETMDAMHNQADSERTSMIVKSKTTKTGKTKWQYNSHIVGALYPMINGKINVALTGQTRGDFARSRNVKPVKAVNYQNFWDEELILQRSTILKKIERIIMERQPQSHEEILSVVDEILAPFEALRSTLGHGKVVEERMGKVEAEGAIHAYNQCKQEKSRLLKQ